jgi:malate dehydrogenase
MLCPTPYAHTNTGLCCHFGVTVMVTCHCHCHYTCFLALYIRVYAGIKRRALLQANSHIFTAVGQALNTYADRNVKTIVLATPALTNALICQSNAPNIPVKNFTALTRLDQNRAIHQLSSKLNVPVNAIKNVVIMGNGSKTQLPNICNAYVQYAGGRQQRIRDVISDDKWLTNEFIHECVERGHAISRITKKTTAGSAATATIQHVRDWLLNDTPANEYVSMAVRSDGSYNIPKDIFFSFPVQCTKGEYRIVQDLEIDEWGKKRLNATIKELQQEKDESHLF